MSSSCLQLLVQHWAWHGWLFITSTDALSQVPHFHRPRVTCIGCVAPPSVTTTAATSVLPSSPSETGERQPGVYYAVWYAIWSVHIRNNVQSISLSAWNLLGSPNEIVLSPSPKQHMHGVCREGDVDLELINCSVWHVGCLSPQRQWHCCCSSVVNSPLHSAEANLKMSTATHCQSCQCLFI